MTLRILVAASALALLSLNASAAFAANDPLAADAPASDASTIVVGSADFPESQLLATIYAKALAAKGIKVDAHMNIGSREVYLPALKDGSIDLLPEYAGAALRYLDKDSTANAPEDVVAALKKVLPTGVSMLDASKAQDTTTVAVTQATADKYKLKSIADLKPHAASLVLGGPPEWKVRPEGVPGMKNIYGLEFKSYKTLDVCGPLTLSALDNGQVDVACMNSTDPAIKSHKLLSLEDPKAMIPSQSIVPLITTSKATKEVAAVLNEVSAALTTDDLIVMNGRVDAHDSYDTIADDWLKSHKID
ncbi:ABC transporter substrate-binding protein [Rhizobium rhizogenes]|uniref:ABC transporter substrate-binding protein n=1 Tax=Rhizobium rhizogenes TaxID=359 RepID=UPI00157413AD|nr:ABC transporter substrate-binding protein [Rhizobium rhizogenes]NTH22877.1 ABC transporter substrate-binding protein [Rhizobium rhizogenes]NTH35906.1 ABC transporter substrate-binding protein [Rhizobium rhizogenes]